MGDDFEFKHIPIMLDQVIHGLDIMVHMWMELWEEAVIPMR